MWQPGNAGMLAYADQCTLRPIRVSEGMRGACRRSCRRSRVVSRSRHHKPGQQISSVVVSSQTPGHPPRDGANPPAFPAPAATSPPLRFGTPGVAIVPSDLLAQVQRQWFWFMVLAGLCFLLAVSSIAGWVLYTRANSTLAKVGTDTRNAGGDVADLREALVRAEARADKSDAAAQSRVALAEQARREADQKREAAESGRREAEQKRDAAERARETAEAKLEAAEMGRSEAEAKASGVEQALALAESKARHTQQTVAAIQENMRRMQMETAIARREMQTAREGERRAIQKLQDVLGEVILADRKDSPLTAGTPGSTGTQASAEVPPPRAPDQPVATAVESPATRPTLPAAEVVVEAPIRKETALSRLERPADPQPDPAVESASPEQLLPWGEAMIVAGYPERGVALIRKAIEKGARGPEYQKSLGWALLSVGEPAEAKRALEAALAGFEDWSATWQKASPDHWAAAFLLGRVKEEEFIRRWARDDKFEARLACLPWFYAGQKREIEGRRDEAKSAYQVSVELGQTAGSYPIWRWAQQRLRDMENAPATTQPTGLPSVLSNE